MFEFNPDRFPDSLLKQGLAGKTGYFMIMLVVAGIITVGAGTFLFNQSIVTMAALAVVVAFIGTRSSIDALKKRETWENKK